MTRTFRQVVQYDPKLGHKYLSNLVACLQYGNGTYLIETDENGFRNSPDKKRDGKIKIVCIGDSYTAGDGVSNQYRFTNLLEQELDCEILNLGVSGYGIDQQLIAYENYAKNFDHDIVLFFPQLDDLKRNLVSAREGIDKSTGNAIYVPKPYFTLENGGLVAHNIPVPRERKLVDGDTSDRDRPATLRNTLADKLRNTAVGKLLIKTLNTQYNLKLSIRTNILNKSSFPEFDDINSAEWKIGIPLIKKLKELTKDKQLVIFPIPFNESIIKNEPSSEYMSIFKTLEDKNTKVYDITDVLKSAQDHSTETVFLKICGHFSYNGHKLIAEQVKAILQSDYKIPAIAKKETKTNKTIVLGISCFYHDSAACILVDGAVVAAAQEERFTRIKHDKAFPVNAINYCLEACRISIHDVSKIVYYDYESWTIERTLWNAEQLGELKEGFLESVKESLYKKLRLPKIIRHKTGYKGDIFKCQHHISHAAGAYYPSPFKEAAILVIDGVGEWACTTIAKGEGNNIKILKQQFYPHSLGLLYSAFTYYTGFKVNSGEYKLMGLAPYGNPTYYDTIKNNLLTIKDDGSIQLDMRYFSFHQGSYMTNDKFAELFGGPARESESTITRREMDLAASIQKVTEEIVIKMANHAHALTGCDNLVMSGGVALNCVSNGKLFDSTPFKDFYFQPASGDAGGAMGCALAWYYENNPKADKSVSESDSAYLGPEFSSDEITAYLDTKGLPHKRFAEGERAKTIAGFLNNNLALGHFDGRMEFGPRALGARSIIANPMNPEMQSKLNLKIKYRESFRPFAPIYMEERTSEYFDFDKPSPHMLIVRKVKDSLLKDNIPHTNTENLLEIINQVRSDIPAITHVDNSARLQSVSKAQNKRFHDVLSEFEKLAGKGILVNTSFNVRGEPIVCTPEDAYRCFMRTEMDVLILGDYYLLKGEQPVFEDTDNWKESYVLD